MTGSILGERVLRKEDPKFLTTGGVYVDDMDEPMLDGGLHVTYARSTMAHARITGIDKSAALALPGVVAVYTGDELAAFCGPLAGGSAEGGGSGSAYGPGAEADEVRGVAGGVGPAVAAGLSRGAHGRPRR